MQLVCESITGINVSSRKCVLPVYQFFFGHGNDAINVDMNIINQSKLPARFPKKQRLHTK